MGTTSEFLGQVPRLTDGKRGGGRSGLSLLVPLASRWIVRGSKVLSDQLVRP